MKHNRAKPSVCLYLSEGEGAGNYEVYTNPAYIRLNQFGSVTIPVFHHNYYYKRGI